MGRPGALTDWSFACPDWEQRLREGRSLVPRLPLDEAEAARAVGIFNRLRIPDVPGQPTMAEAAGDWQRDIVRAIFGSIDPATGRRRVGEVFCLVPKKNSKTTGAAAIGLTAMLMNVRPRAEMLILGPTQAIAETGFQQAVGMIDADAEHDPQGRFLQRRFLPQEHTKTILDLKTRARLKIKTFDAKILTGAKPVVAIVDELHVLALLKGAANVFGQIRGGFLANPESLLVIITTQSDSEPVGLFKTELEYARGVRDGRITGPRVRMLPVLYEFPEAVQTSDDKQWMDPALWPMVTPNLGRSVTIDRLIEDFEGAREKGEEELRRWASQHLNIQIGLAMHAGGWRGAAYWLARADKSLTLDELIARSEVIVAGIDGGGLDDLLGLALIGRERGTGKWLIWGKAWAHDDVLERRKDIAERLKDFDKDGDLVIIGHNGGPPLDDDDEDEGEDPSEDADGEGEPPRVAGDDVVELADIIVRVRDAGLLPAAAAVGLDPHGVADIVDELDRRGLTEEQMVPVAQGYRLHGDIKGLERRLKKGGADHSGSPLLNWNVGNAKVEQRGNAVLITKQACGTAKIDVLIAILCAHHLMSRNPTAAGNSYLETSAVLMI
ncbi:MAG TPA: terminase TerL endonuclease subunit [Caulobacteraceae bacterium]|jgi:phage terminase large subunit-like protein